MTTNRYQTHRIPRPTLYLGISPAYWSGTAFVALVLAGVLYCLLTHRVPV